MLLHYLKAESGAVEEIDEALRLLSSTSVETKNDTDVLEYSKLKAQFEEEISLMTNDEEFEESCRLERRKRQLFCDDLFQLKSPSKVAPALEDFVDIKYNSARGRHLILNKDIPIGKS